MQHCVTIETGPLVVAHEILSCDFKNKDQLQIKAKKLQEKKSSCGHTKTKLSFALWGRNSNNRTSFDLFLLLFRGGQPSLF